MTIESNFKELVYYREQLEIGNLQKITDNNLPICLSVYKIRIIIEKIMVDMDIVHNIFCEAQFLKKEDRTLKIFEITGALLWPDGQKLGEELFAEVCKCGFLLGDHIRNHYLLRK